MEKQKKELTYEDHKRKAYNSLRRKILKLCKEGNLQIAKNSLEYYQSNKLTSLPSKLMNLQETISCYDLTITEYIETL